jgi:hypothetical protein
VPINVALPSNLSYSGQNSRQDACTSFTLLWLLKASSKLSVACVASHTSQCCIAPAVLWQYTALWLNLMENSDVGFKLWWGTMTELLDVL